MKSSNERDLPLIKNPPFSYKGSSHTNGKLAQLIAIF